MYILKISNKAFIQIKDKEIVIISDYEKATRYNTIGKAMKIAAELNKQFESHIVRVINLSF